MKKIFLLLVFVPMMVCAQRPNVMKELNRGRGDRSPCVSLKQNVVQAIARSKTIQIYIPLYSLDTALL